MNTMVRKRERQNQPVHAAAVLRDQADALLRRLEHSRQESERRMAEFGRRDAIKHVTGRTALDDAVLRTRAMIQQVDGLLEAMHCEIGLLEKRDAVSPQPIHRHANGSSQRESRPVAMLGV